jgi:hypothetical protein
MLDRGKFWEVFKGSLKEKIFLRLVQDQPCKEHDFRPRSYSPLISLSQRHRKGAPAPLVTNLILAVFLSKI